MNYGDGQVLMLKAGMPSVVVGFGRGTLSVSRCVSKKEIMRIVVYDDQWKIDFTEVFSAARAGPLHVSFNDEHFFIVLYDKK